MKFRVYDTKAETYLASPDIIMNSQGEFFFVNLSDLIMPLFKPLEDRYKVEFATGFEALGGTEIYEGDVISVKYTEYHERDISSDYKCHYEGKVIKYNGIWVIDLNKWNKAALHTFPSEAKIKIIK